MTNVVFKISKIVTLFFMDLLHALKNYLKNMLFIHLCFSKYFFKCYKRVY